MNLTKFSFIRTGTTRLTPLRATAALEWIAALNANMFVTRLMLKGVLTRGEDHQIVKRVILGIPVFMVNVFVSLKRSSHMLLHYGSMQVFISRWVERIGSPKINTPTFLRCRRRSHWNPHLLKSTPNSCLGNPQGLSQNSGTLKSGIMGNQPSPVFQFWRRALYGLNAKTVKSEFHRTPTASQFLRYSQRRFRLIFTAKPILVVQLWISRSGHVLHSSRSKYVV